MKMAELFEATFRPQIGKCYRLADKPEHGDYAGETVFVETGPRNAGLPSEQYRVSTGPNNYDVDWIDTSMFDGAVEVDEPPNIRYVKKNP
jgi:hypothetical protein